MAVSVVKYEELKSLYQAEVRKRLDREAEISAAARANDSLMEEIKQLKAQAAEAHGQFQKRVEELQAGCDAATNLYKTALDERDVARQEADYLRKRAQEAGERADQLQEQLNIKQMELASSKDEIGRLVRLADDFKTRLEDVKNEKNAIIDNLARERDELQAEYDARGRVIKKLRKRLHKLKKKLKH